MEEKILTQKKNGLAALIGLLVGDLVLVLAFISAIASLPEGFPLAIAVITCIFLFIASLVCYAGIKIIKPQEALGIILEPFEKRVFTLSIPSVSLSILPITPAWAKVVMSPPSHPCLSVKQQKVTVFLSRQVKRIFP